jgi:hypothetical protein
VLKKGFPFFRQYRLLLYFLRESTGYCCDVLLVLLKGPYGNKLQAQLKAQFIYDNPDGLLTIRVCKFGHH